MIALKSNKSVKSCSYEEAYVRVQKTNKTNLKASDIRLGSVRIIASDSFIY